MAQISTINRVNTVQCLFDRKSRPTALEIHDWIFRQLEVPDEVVDVFQVDFNLISVFIKFTSVNNCDRFNRLFSGNRTIRHFNGKTSIVNVIPCGYGIRNVRLFNVPPECPNQIIVNALNKYGTVSTITDENWSSAFPFKGKSGVKSVKIDLKSHIPSYLLIAGTRAQVQYSGQPPTCSICHSSEHLREKCPKRRPAQLPRDDAENTSESFVPLMSDIVAGVPTRPRVPAPPEPETEVDLQAEYDPSPAVGSTGKSAQEQASPSPVDENTEHVDQPEMPKTVDVVVDVPQNSEPQPALGEPVKDTEQGEKLEDMEVENGEALPNLETPSEVPVTNQKQEEEHFVVPKLPEPASSKSKTKNADPKKKRTRQSKQARNKAKNKANKVPKQADRRSSQASDTGSDSDAKSRSSSRDSSTERSEKIKERTEQLRLLLLKDKEINAGKRKLDGESEQSSQRPRRSSVKSSLGSSQTSGDAPLFTDPTKTLGDGHQLEMDTRTSGDAPLSTGHTEALGDGDKSEIVTQTLGADTMERQYIKTSGDTSLPSGPTQASGDGSQTAHNTQTLGDDFRGQSAKALGDESMQIDPTQASGEDSWQITHTQISGGKDESVDSTMASDSAAANITWWSQTKDVGGKQ